MHGERQIHHRDAIAQNLDEATARCAVLESTFPGRQSSLISFASHFGALLQHQLDRHGDLPRRFVVTSLTTSAIDPRTLYEPAARSRRIKEQQLDLFADRTSPATMRANQLRL